MSHDARAVADLTRLAGVSIAPVAIIGELAMYGHGAYPHLMLEERAKRSSPSRTGATLVFLRPSFGGEEGLLQEIRNALGDHATLP